MAPGHLGGTRGEGLVEAWRCVSVAAAFRTRKGRLRSPRGHRLAVKPSNTGVRGHGHFAHCYLQPMSCLIPAPDIEADLGTTLDRQSGMDRVLVTFTVGIEVLPKHCAALSWLKGGSLIHAIAFDKLTPSLISRPRYSRKLSSTSGTLISQVHHVRADSPELLARSGPIIMVCVMSSDVVALRP